MNVLAKIRELQEDLEDELRKLESSEVKDQKRIEFVKRELAKYNGTAHTASSKTY